MADELNRPEIKNFIEAFVEEDIGPGGQYEGMQVHTRFPPEPNGYLHIGHCKALCIDFGTAEKFGGICNLRMDDTNPTKEDTEYVEAIKEDIRWLGFTWDDRFYYASQYFDKMYECAEDLIRKGLAYVCELTPEQMREYRGDLTTPARSPYRDRPIEESLDLFRRMKAGEFPNGAMTLRAKIDLASGNFNMRDPAIYRILHKAHHRQGNKWCIYPLYDYAHPVQDAIEGITHSLCSIEFENHRPLYDWVADNVDLENRPHQYEFARLNVTNTVMSKRYLREMVETGLVDGWDDPRMPTLCGLRRRGFTPSAIIEFVKRAGVAKANSLVDIGLLEFCIREELNAAAPRRVAVLDPVEVEITNYPDGKEEFFELANNPNDEAAGSRSVRFSKHLVIDREDFALDPPPKFFRLKKGGEVRLMGAYIIRCEDAVTDETGRVVKLFCTADLETGNGNPADGRKVKGTIHWLDAETAEDCDIRLYDRLFTLENVAEIPEGKTYSDYINPESLCHVTGCKVEPCLKAARPGDRFQFVRLGYFCADSKYAGSFNRIVTLRDSYAKGK